MLTNGLSDHPPRLYSLDHCLLSGEKRIKWLSWLKKVNAMIFHAIDHWKLMLLIWRCHILGLWASINPSNFGVFNSCASGIHIFSWPKPPILCLANLHFHCEPSCVSNEARDLQPRLIGWLWWEPPITWKTIIMNVHLLGGLADSDRYSIF